MGNASSLVKIPKKNAKAPVKASQQTPQQTHQQQPQVQQNNYYSQTPQYQSQPQPNAYYQQTPQYPPVQAYETPAQVETKLTESSKLKTKQTMQQSALKQHCSGLQKQFITWLNNNLQVNFDAMRGIQGSSASYKKDCFDMAYFLSDQGDGDYTRFDQVKHPKFFEKTAGKLELSDIYKDMTTSLEEALYFEVRVLTSKEIYKKIFVEGLPLDDYITLTLIVDDYAKSLQTLSSYLKSKNLSFWVESTTLGNHRIPALYVVKLPSKCEENKLIPIKVELLDYRSSFLMQEHNFKPVVHDYASTRQLYERNKWNWRATIESLYDHNFLTDDVYTACLKDLPAEEEGEEINKHFASFQTMTFEPRYGAGIEKQSKTEAVKDMGKSLFNSVKNPLKSLAPALEKVGDITKIKALGFNPNKLKGQHAFQPNMLEDHEVFIKSLILLKSQQKFMTNYCEDTNGSVFTSSDQKNRCLHLKFFMEENNNEYQELLKGEYFKKWTSLFRIDYALETLFNWITKQANNCLVKLDVKSELGAIGKVFLRSKALNDFGRATVISNNPKIDILKLGRFLTDGNEFGFWYEDSSNVQDYPVFKIYIYYKTPEGNATTMPFGKIMPIEVQFISPDLYFYYKNTDFHDNYELYRCLELKKNAYEKYRFSFQQVTTDLINAGLLDIKETFGKQPGFFKEIDIKNNEYIAKIASAAREYDNYGVFNYSSKTQKMAYASQFRQWECFATTSVGKGEDEIVRTKLNGLGCEEKNGFLFFNFLTNVTPLEFKTNMAIRMEVFLAMGFFMTFASKTDTSFHYVLAITKDHVSWKKSNSKANYFSDGAAASSTGVEKEYGVQAYKPTKKRLHIHTIWIYFDRNDLIQIKIDDRLLTFDVTWPKGTDKLDIILRPIIKNTALKSICVYDERVASGSAGKYLVSSGKKK